ncbi:MAG TPA: SUMF1/EgtB/PvdO family nonheme iron enzyme [Polyangiaceae bacterium]|nr:SUMF1/EgtB/PvdO family nonheme iron enzyme [Polyangiaceae bacterium]
MPRRIWIFVNAVLLPTCSVDDRALGAGGRGAVTFVTGGADAGGAGGDGALAGASAASDGDAGSSDGGGSDASGRGGGAGPSARGGTTGDAGGEPVGVGTAGLDASGPCEGEGCSCQGLGAKACARQSCCASLSLPAGEFALGAGPAEIAAFRLDEFEVSVGRFRRFVDSYLRPPAPDAGQHDYVIGSGWMPDWSAKMPETRAELVGGLACEGQTWTDAVAERESLPMNCVTWFEAFAFCAWDGGRLPTEAEWEYAAAGGDQARTFPWGDEAPASSLAVYACDEGATCVSSVLAAVGSKPDGAARYGQLDLAGSLAEWTLDYFAPYEAACDNCANVGNGTERVARGGALTSSAKSLKATAREAADPETRDYARGFRCARRP